MRRRWRMGTRLWSLHLVQELCRGHKGETHWPPTHSVHKHRTKGSRCNLSSSRPLLPSAPLFQSWRFPSWGPCIKQAEQASTIRSVMSEHVHGNWQFVFHPESRNRCLYASTFKIPLITQAERASHTGSRCWALCRWQAGRLQSLHTWICLTDT